MAIADLKIVEPLNLDKYFGPDGIKVRNRIRLVGLEVEGAWIKFPATEKYEHDGSVFKPESYGGQVEWDQVKLKIASIKATTTGEIPSAPMLPAQMRAWITKNYPDFTDKTCGLHVHMSFEDLKHYNRLMTPEYPITMRTYLKKWAVEEHLPDDHPIWDRVNGNNMYCSSKFWPDKQVGKKKSYDHGEGDRYTDINYCWKEHKTIECRILPMMSDAALAYRAAKRVLDITNATLVKITRREKRELEEVGNIPTSKYVERDVEEV